MISFALYEQKIGCDAAPAARLTGTLRETFGLIGIKVGCDAGDCGACTGLINGKCQCACLIPNARIHGGSVETV